MGKPDKNKVYEFDHFRLDAAHRMLYRENGEVPLAPKAVETLLVLIQRRGEILSKDELMNAIWTDSIVEESNLAQYLHVLRKTLGQTQNGKPFIETLRRRGYRFNGDVTVTESTNGNLPPQRRDATGSGHVFEDQSGGTAHQSQHTFRVEKRGNVLALTDWKDSDREASPGPDITEPAFSEANPVANRDRRRWYIAFAVAAVLLVGTLSIVWFRTTLNVESSPVNSELTFSNLTSGESVDFATISRDGNYFVYASHDGEKAHLWLQQTGQATRLEMIPPFTGAIYGTTFTPDSQFVYFVASENANEPNVLYRVPTLGGVKTNILTDVDAPVSFSPDGSEIAFMRGDKETNRSLLLLVASDGTQERVLSTGKVDEVFYGGGAWSPDGSLVAYGVLDLRSQWQGGCTIVATDPKSGETTNLSPEKWDTCFRMAWTTNGEGLVFVGTKSGEALSTRRDQLYYISLADGASRRLTTDGSRHQYLSLGITDQDEILAVPFNRSSQIWTMDASGDSRDALQITQGFADGRGGIAPLADGRVAYLTRHGDGFSIWLMNGDGSDRRQLTTDPPAIEELRCSPDGRFFVFSARRDGGGSNLYRLDADGANRKQLTFGETHEADSTVSPDGNWIVYESFAFDGNERKSALWKIPSDGGAPTVLTNVVCNTPHYSPDGKWISCVSPDWKKISILSAETGEALKTLEPDQNPILNTGARWTPDGKALSYISVSKNIGNIRIQPIDGQPSRFLTDFTSGDIYNFAFTSDGKRIIIARGYQIRNAVLIKLRS